MTDHSHNIDALDGVTKTLTNSDKGYEKACELSDGLQFPTEFRVRCDRRFELLNKFQSQVRTLGGEPQTDGGAFRAVHCANTEFISVRRDDERAS